MTSGIYLPEEIEALRLRFLAACAAQGVQPNEPAAERIAAEVIFHCQDIAGRYVCVKADAA